MADALIKARLAQLAAEAEVTRLKAEQRKHWDGELEKEVQRIAAIANDIVQQLNRKN